MDQKAESFRGGLAEAFAACHLPFGLTRQDPVCCYSQSPSAKVMQLVLALPIWFSVLGDRLGLEKVADFARSRETAAVSLCESLRK